MGVKRGGPGPGHPQAVPGDRRERRPSAPVGICGFSARSESWKLQKLRDLADSQAKRLRRRQIKKEII